MSTQPFALTPEAINGNSLTKFLRSITNSLGQSGAQTFGQGQNVVAQGLQDFQGPLSYYQDILSGDKSKMESAIAPEKSDILSQYRARRRKLAQGQRGGGTNEAVAQSEFSQAGDISALLQKLRPQAAQGEAQIAGQIAQVGLVESDIGNSQLFQALAGILGERGQGVSEHNAMLGLAASSASTLASLI